MAWWIAAAAALGGAAQAGFNYLGQKKQAEAAKKAGKRQELYAQLSSNLIGQAEEDAQLAIQAGRDRSREVLGEQRGSATAQQERVGDIFAQDRAAGSEALARLQELTRDPEALQRQMEEDAGYQFRLAEGQKAIERQARAAGSFGGGANLKDFARFSQGLASEEKERILSRLMGLAEFGQKAGVTEASLGTQLEGFRQGAYGQQAGMEYESGVHKSNLGMRAAEARAAALTGGAVGQGQADIAAAQANPYGAIGSGVGSAANTAMMMYMMSRSKS